MKYNNMNVSYTNQCVLVQPLRSLNTYTIPMASASCQRVISNLPMRSIEKVKIPARSTGYVPISLMDVESKGPFILTPKAKLHGKDNSICSAPFMVVSPETSYVEYTNFSSDDVFVQSGQVLGNLKDLDGDDTFIQAFNHEDRINGTKLDDMMVDTPTDLEPDEIDVGITQKDLGINPVHQTAFGSLPKGFYRPVMM